MATIHRRLSKSCRLLHGITSFTRSFCSTTEKVGAGTIASIFDESETGTEELRNINASIKRELQHNLYADTLGNKQKLNDAWNDLTRAMESEHNYITKNQDTMIPVIDMKRILNCSTIQDLTSSFIGDLCKKVGVFIITNVIDDALIAEWKDELREYIDLNTNPQRNAHPLLGSPADNPQVYEIYWSRPQIKARQHPNLIKAMCFANHLWSFERAQNNQNTVDVPVMYVDRLRIREPMDESFDFLGPHLDSGSIERWQDAQYRQCYDEIFALQWREWNGYNATHRVHAKQDLYNTENCCTAFRSHQGWLSLSTTVAGNGTLRVCPVLKEATSYLMLRPFVGDLEEWNMTEIWGGYGLKLKDKYHQLLIDSMVSIPRVNPGDMVFWHCDTIHAVEPKNDSKTSDSSVFYIPACFDCDINRVFVAKQRERFLSGTSPPDFPQTDCELKWENRATVEDLDDLGRMVMQI